MEYWDNSYTPWGWYNEILEHRNNVSLFEADGKQQTTAVKGGDNTEPKNEGGTENTTAKNKNGADAEGSDQDKAEKNKEEPVSKFNESNLEKKYLNKEYSDQLGTEAGEYLVELQNSFAGSKISTYNPWKMKWSNHPDNIAAQLKYLFPNKELKIWSPEYKDVRSYDPEDVRGLGERRGARETTSVGDFNKVMDTLCGNEDLHCSAAIQLNDKNNPITNVFDLDRDELEELAKELGFSNPINIDIFGLLSVDDRKRKNYINKMRDNQQYEAGRLKEIAKDRIAEVFPPDILYMPLTSGICKDIENAFKDKSFSKESDIKKSANIIKIIDLDSAKQKTRSKGRKNDQDNDGIPGVRIQHGNHDIREVVEDILFRSDELSVSYERSNNNINVPTGLISMLYNVTGIMRKGDTIKATLSKRAGLKFTKLPAYIGYEDGIEDDNENILIKITEIGKAEYGIEARIGLIRIFSTTRPLASQRQSRGAQQDSVNITKPNYLSPLIGLDLSGIRREIMESSNLNGLLEASLNEFLPKRGRKAPKYIKHPYKGTNGSITYKGIKQKENGAARTMWLVPSDSDPSKTYTVQVDVEVPGKGGLFSIARKKNRKPGELIADRNNLRTSNLRVYCSCPDFHWGGAEYNLGKKDSVIQNPETTDGNPGGRYKHTTKDGKSYVETYPTTVKPEKRDPLGIKDSCKHIYAVLLEFRRKIPTIFADAKKAPADLEKVGSFNENTGILVQTPEAQGIMNELADIALPDNAEQTQMEPTEQTEQTDQAENQIEDMELVSEGEPEEYAVESEPEQSSEEDLAEETVPEEDNGVEKNKGLFARIKDGLSSLKDKAGNALGRIFRHEDCELAGKLIERALESDDPHVIQDSVNRIAALLEANGKHECAKSLLESSEETSTKHIK